MLAGLLFYQNVSLDGAKTPLKSLSVGSTRERFALNVLCDSEMFVLVVFYLVQLQRHTMVQIHMSSNAQQTYFEEIF